MQFVNKDNVYLKICFNIFRGVSSRASFLGELFLIRIHCQHGFPGSDQQTAVCLWRDSITVRIVVVVEVEVCSQQQQ